jgi:hypothetical protein
MSDFNHGDVGMKFQTLVGQSNFNRWLRDFKSIADEKGLWGLFIGGDEILKEPLRDAYFRPTKR